MPANYHVTVTQIFTLLTIKKDDAFQREKILIHIYCIQVLYRAFVVASTGRCDEEVLSLLLKLPENNSTSLVVEELCSLPALDLYTMFVLIIQNLNVRHIIYKVRCFIGR